MKQKQAVLFGQLGKWPNLHQPSVGKARYELAARLARQIAEAVGSDDDRVWWARCVETVGPRAVDRGLGLLKEAKATGKVTNPGGLLTKFFKDIAAEAGASFR